MEENSFHDLPANGKKRKRMADCISGDPNQTFQNAETVESDQSRDTSYVTSDSMKAMEEQNACENINTLNAKQSVEQSQIVSALKEKYVRVRARRCQATNSHSLAERVRMEKISESMKFLQDLVPGCNKIIARALMLDEIINYVESLQKQSSANCGRTFVTEASHMSLFSASCQCYSQSSTGH